jgi:hypothetical protein
MGEFRMKCCFSRKNPNPSLALSCQSNRASVVHCDIACWAYLQCLAVVESEAVGSFIYGPSIGPYLSTCEWFVLPVRIIAVCQVIDLETRQESWGWFAVVLIGDLFHFLLRWWFSLSGGALLFFVGWVVLVWLAFVHHCCFRICFLGLMLLALVRFLWYLFCIIFLYCCGSTMTASVEWVMGSSDATIRHCPTKRT